MFILEMKINGKWIASKYSSEVISELTSQIKNIQLEYGSVETRIIQKPEIKVPVKRKRCCG